MRPIEHNLGTSVLTAPPAPAQAVTKEVLPIDLPRHFGLLRTRAMKDTVGIVRACYGLEKTTYSLPLKKYRYRRVRQLPIHKLERSGTFLSYTPAVMDNSLPLLHTWNQLPVSGHRFVVSFENELPRYLNHPKQWQMRFGLRRMRSKSCRRILALSQTAADLMRGRMERSGEREISEKVVVFRGGIKPSQLTKPSELADRPLRVLFVGADGFRKGIVPCFEAVEELRAGGVDVTMTVVGNVSSESYVLLDQTPDANAWRQKLADTPWVTWHTQQSNSQVRGLMAHHHVLLLPSLDETLGWVVIEAAMESRPSIVSNIFAFEELVRDGETGTVIKLDRREDLRWKGLETSGDELRSHVERTNQTIHTALVRELAFLAANPHVAVERGAAACQYLGALYDCDSAARQIETIYDAALA